MGFWRRTPAVPDLISARDLADFGRACFLGPDASGISEWLPLIDPLSSQTYHPGSTAHQRAIDEVRRHATQGMWEKVGAWKFTRDFLDRDDPALGDLIDGGLLSIAEMRVTNLASHLAPIDLPRHVELAGTPMNDDFFGPPVFDSAYGPTKQYYFDHAVAAANSRTIARLPNRPDVRPGDLTEVARKMWDFGLLINRGPLVGSQDIASEPNVLRTAVAAATHIDHALFVDMLLPAIRDHRARNRKLAGNGGWYAIDAARFVEDYLDLGIADQPAAVELLDDGLRNVLGMGALGVSMSADVLTSRQRYRLSELESEG